MQWYSHHIGELILAAIFIVAVTAFTLVYLLKGTESQLLGSAVIAAISALATYMQKRSQPSATISGDGADVTVETKE